LAAVLTDCCNYFYPAAILFSCDDTKFTAEEQQQKNDIHIYCCGVIIGYNMISNLYCCIQQAEQTERERVERGAAAAAIRMRKSYYCSKKNVDAEIHQLKPHNLRISTIKLAVLKRW